MGGGGGGGANTKPRDAEILRAIRRDEVMFRFGGDAELELDVSDLDPNEAARIILAHVNKVKCKRVAGRESQDGKIVESEPAGVPYPDSQ